jgi:hypothetical protein
MGYLGNFFLYKKNITKKKKEKKNLDWAIAQPRLALATPLGNGYTVAKSESIKKISRGG